MLSLLLKAILKIKYNNNLMQFEKANTEITLKKIIYQIQ